MFTVNLEQATTSLFSGWDWIDLPSEAVAMEKFSSCIVNARLNKWTHIWIENEQGDIIAEWCSGTVE